MPMLYRPPAPKRAPKAPPQRAAHAPVVAVVGAHVEARLAGVLVSALPEGALWVEEARALIVSDLHLEKGSSYARGGQLLPPYDTRATLARVAALIDAKQPDIVVSLGDSFHDCGGPGRMDPDDCDMLKSLIARCDWIWVEGNHDGKSAETLGGVVREVLHLGKLVLRHEPTEASAPGEIAGHLHPCAKVHGRGRTVRRRCFAMDGERMIMPAFGAYTGGLNVCDKAYAKIFPGGAMALLLGRGRVHPAPVSRLLSDG